MVHDLGVVFIAVVDEHDLQAVPLGHLPRDVVAVLVVEVGVVAGVAPADGGGAPVEGGGPGAAVLGEDVQQDGEGAVRPAIPLPISQSIIIFRISSPYFISGLLATFRLL